MDGSGGAIIVWEHLAAVYGVLGSPGRWGTEEPISVGSQLEPLRGKLRPDVVRDIYEGIVATWAGS